MKYYTETVVVRELVFELNGTKVYRGAKNYNEIFIDSEYGLQVYPRRFFDKLNEAFKVEPKFLNNFTGSGDTAVLECTVPRNFGEQYLAVIGGATVRKGHGTNEITVGLSQGDSDILEHTFTLEVMNKILETIPPDNTISEYEYKHDLVSNRIWEETKWAYRNYPWHMLIDNTPLDIEAASMIFKQYIEDNAMHLEDGSLHSSTIALNMFEAIPGGAVMLLTPLFGDLDIGIIENGKVNYYKKYYVFVHSNLAFLPLLSKEPVTYLQDSKIVCVPSGKAIKDVYYKGVHKITEPFKEELIEKH